MMLMFALFDFRIIHSLAMWNFTTLILTFKMKRLS